MYKSGRIGF